MSTETLFVINPLNSTLRHYERELVDTLKLAGYQQVSLIPTVEGEGITSTPQRIRIAVASLVERVRLGYSVHGRTVIITWPLFGYLDPWTLWRLCRGNRVFIVFHDPTPLRRTYGHSPRSRRLFKWVVSATCTDVIYHTELAQRTGIEMSGVTGVVVPHPLAASSTDESVVAPPPEMHSTVRVLGQNKLTRAITPLEEIASHRSAQLRLEIHGRGWPAVEGWAVTEGFVSEADFEGLIRTADCVVIPYDSFFQSGVAARCLEHGVRIVAPHHEHIIELYGADWPGLVRDENDWYAAVSRALAADPGHLANRADEVRKDIACKWSAALER